MLLLLAAFARLNSVGLPDFVKTRLVAALHERGVELEFYPHAPEPCPWSHLRQRADRSAKTPGARY